MSGSFQKHKLCLGTGDNQLTPGWFFLVSGANKKPIYIYLTDIVASSSELRFFIMPTAIERKWFKIDPLKVTFYDKIFILDGQVTEL